MLNRECCYKIHYTSSGALVTLGEDVKAHEVWWPVRFVM